MTDKPIIDRINTELDELYTEDEKALWWVSGQPLFADRLPVDLIQEGRGQDVLRKLRTMTDGAYI